VQPPIGAHGAEIRLRLQDIVDCPHETGETGIVRPRLAAYAAQASLYTEAIKERAGGDCTNIADAAAKAFEVLPIRRRVRH